MAGRDVAVEHVAQEAAQVPVELARKSDIEPQTGRRGEIAHEEVAKRLECADGERRNVWKLRCAARAERPADGRLPSVGLFREALTAVRALTELGTEPRAIEEVEIEPPAHHRRVDAGVETAERGLQEVEERRGWNAVRGEAIHELRHVPPRRDQREIVAHVRIDRPRLSSSEHVELAAARELIRRVRQRLRVAGHAARRSSYAFRDDAHLAAIDEEIRSLLNATDPALGPFYGMMLYHLGLDAERRPSGKRLRPVLCTLVFEAMTGDARQALPAAAAIELLHNFTLIHD